MKALRVAVPVLIAGLIAANHSWPTSADGGTPLRAMAVDTAPHASQYRILDSSAPWHVPLTSLGGAEPGDIVGGIRLAGGTVVIGETGTKGLWFVDSAGKVRFALKPGINMPGRATSIWSLFRDPRGVAVWDDVADVVDVVSANGRPVSESRLEHPPRYSHPDGSDRATMRLLGRVGQSWFGLVWDPWDSATRPSIRADSADVTLALPSSPPVKLGTVLRSEYFDYCGQHCIPDDTLPFGRVGSVAADAAHWYQTDGDRYVVQQFTRDRLTATFGVNHDRCVVTTRAIQRVDSAILARSDPVLRPDWELALRWVQYPKRCPAYTQVLVDASGDVWARAWTFPDEPELWDVFRPEGAYRGEVHTPVDFTVLDAGPIYVLGVHSGDGRHGEIRLYRLR